MNTSFERTVVLDKFVSPIFYASLIVLFASAYLVLQALDANQSLFFSVNYASQQILSDALAAHLTELGNGALVGVLALLLVILSPDVAKRFLFITLLAAVVIAGLKQLFNDPRPAGILSIEEFHIIGDVLKKYSFPSGHTTTAFAMAGFVLLTYQNLALRSTALVLAILAGFARISVGAHWPEDVFSGAALGLILAFIGAYLSQQPFKRLGSYLAGAFLALACLIGNVTAPADFPEIASIGCTRLLFALLAIFIGCYFCIRLLQEYSATKKAASD
ncbi:MAG: phosphatase PAP2 family protein [Oleispira sp.]|nr:phosphatase PAP2 family protein [Oleispira sp.]